MAEIGKLQSAQPASNTGVSKAETKKQKPGLIFEENGNISRAEKRALRRDDELDLSRAEIRKYSAMEGGEEFLDRIANAKGEDIQAARKQIALDYFIGTVDYDNVDKETIADLKRFGVTQEDLQTRLDLNRLDRQRPVGQINPDVVGGDTTVTSARINVAKDKDGNISSLLLYENDYNNKEAKPTRLLSKDGEYFVDEDKEHYYKFNAKENVLSEVTSTVKAAEAAKAAEAEKIKQGADAEVEQTVTEPPKFQEVFAKNKTVNIDETGSKQRLTRNEQWSTNLVVPRKAEFNEAGMPTQLAIELPSDYGAKGSDGAGQKRYQVLNLVDPENNIYTDKAGIRHFQMEVTEDGVKLNLYNPDDKKIKSFLDKNTEIVQEKAKESGLNEQQKKMEITAQEESKQIMTQLSDRNSSWETYTQIGTDVGHITGAHGLLEKLVDEQDVTGLKTFNDLKPAIDGLMARVPESVTTTPEYKAVQDAIAKLAENPDADIKSSWFNQAIGSDTDIRKLDRALMNLAKTHLAGSIQGANHANNAYLVGGNGSVVITPDREKGVWNTDAKFQIGGQDYYLYQERALIDRTVDFQDVIEHQDDGKRDKLSLIRNEVTGNNRHGEIKFDAKKAEAETFYFKADNGVKLPVIVEDGVAYIQGSDKKVPVEDVLNGRVPMPS